MMSPSTELNKAVSSERSYATVTISLSEAKDVAKRAGGKLNDVVLALSSGVLRRHRKAVRYGSGVTFIGLGAVAASS